MSLRAVAALLVVVCAGLGLQSSARAGDGGSPYFGTDFDCSPVMTDRQALDVANGQRSVVETVRFTGPRNYSCSWTLSGAGTGIVLIVAVSDLSDRAARRKQQEAMCSPDLPLSASLRRQLCDAAEDMVAVRSASAAFDAYVRLARASGGGGQKARIELGDGIRGYWVGASGGGAMTMITPGWTVVQAACLDIKKRSLQRDCSTEALRVTLRNMRARMAEFCDGPDGSPGGCRAPLPTPTPRSKPKARTGTRGTSAH